MHGVCVQTVGRMGMAEPGRTTVVCGLRGLCMLARTCHIIHAVHRVRPGCLRPQAMPYGKAAAGCAIAYASDESMPGAPGLHGSAAVYGLIPRS